MDQKHLACFVVAAVVAISLWFVFPHTPAESDSQPDDQLPNEALSLADIEALRPQVMRFCADCHGFPQPHRFPRDAWYAEVKQGYEFYYDSRRSDLTPPPMRDVVAFYRAQAPAQLKITAPPGSAEARIAFEKDIIDLPAGHMTAMVSHVSFTPAKSAENRAASSGVLRFCDMKSGVISNISTDRIANDSIVAKLNNPAHLEVIDLNNDGRMDMVVSDLGSETPGDHTNGRVVWLQSNVDGTHTVVPIADNLGRVADARPADFDGDGDTDLVVAEFGWRESGKILLLEQTSMGDVQHARPEFKKHVIDERHGTIHVPVADLNDDGRPDFIALISQEHEVVEAFLNNGDGTFRTEKIYAAEEPAWGSSGIQVVDLDGDNDLDVVYTNGDTLDSHLVKPYHAVHWLENKGTFPFHHRLLTQLPGASRASAADLDADGDLDIAVSSFLPAELLHQVPDGEFDTLIWLEQTQSGEFAYHRIEHSGVGHLSMQTGDFDGNGTIDIAVGNFPGKEWGAVWWNRGGLASAASRLRAAKR